jgi:hypothetical protein
MKMEIKIMEKEILYLKRRNAKEQKEPTTNFSKNARLMWTGRINLPHENRINHNFLHLFLSKLLYSIQFSNSRNSKPHSQNLFNQPDVSFQMLGHLAGKIN